MVGQLADVQRAPQRRLRADQTSLNKAGTALGSLANELESLLNKAKALKEAQLFDSFRSMEKTLAQINRQAAFFTQRFSLT